MSNDQLAQFGETLGAVGEQYRQQMDQLAEVMTELFRPMQEGQNQLAAVGSQISSSIQPLLETLANIDWPNIYTRMGQSCDRLALLGWALPMTFTPRELVALAEQSTDQEIEQYMLDYFTQPDGVRLQLRGSVLHGETLKGWRDLLEQCFEAYDRKHYLIVIPALLSVIEGAVAENAGKLRSGRVKPEKLASDLENDASQGSMQRLIWRSTRIVMERLFAGSHFGGPHPGRLNRHWVLHGRDQTQWTQTDALRLFNLLATIP
jgi:hypothetical protein